MTTFEERLNRLGHSNREPVPETTPDVVDPPAERGGALRYVVMLPLAVAMGAASVVLGGIIQVAVIDGGLTSGAEIPPQLGMVAFAIAFVMSFVADKLTGPGHLGPIAVSVGFVAMMFQEWRLAEAYPKLWETLYRAEYLEPVIQFAGL